MPINSQDLIGWVDSKAPHASTELEQRIITGRAYYAAFHGCLEKLTIEPLDPATNKGGLHKRYIDALKLDSDRVLNAIGRKLDIIKETRTEAEYRINANYSRRSMTATITTSKEILHILKNY
jgi:uncharacterized protein (UPF0332 family)